MAIVFIVHASMEPKVARKVIPVLLAAFALRLLVHVLVMRESVIHYGGDQFAYEARAMEVVAFWQRQGFRFVTSEDIGSLYSVAVPCNLFAVIIHLCGGAAPLACTAVVALFACLLCIVLYRFARLVGADDRAAFILLVLTAFTPAFLLHTSDMFKDGFNAFLVVSVLGLGISSVRRFDVRKLIVLGALLWALWYVRPYMVFMCAVPLILGLAGLRRGLSLRGLLTVAILATVILFGSIGGSAPVEILQEQLEYGQSDVVRSSNAVGGSGVGFDDNGDPWGSLGPKLFYTVFSPFPWSSGSLELQLGKIEVFIWYFIIYSAVRGSRRLWHENRNVLLILLLFIVPGTIVYATAVANVGLIFRQRMPIVMITSLLAAMAWTRIPRSRTAVMPDSGETAEPAAPGLGRA
ncbi:hypothetical protein AB0M44_00020 [Streptosporangium subroseum]|uniref:hypothetical protein n=1 Tax=Streptosporangium subroseum TaxID=106412 RepID=UPI00344A32FD